MDLTVLLEFLSSGGVLSASLILIYLMLTGRLVPKERLADVAKERDEARRRLDEGLGQVVHHLDELDRDIEEMRREVGLPPRRKVGDRD